MLLIGYVTQSKENCSPPLSPSSSPFSTPMLTAINTPLLNPKLLPLSSKAKDRFTNRFPFGTMTTTRLLLLLFTIFSFLHYLYVSSFEYQVGDHKGWAVPPANDTRIYNDWASENRFQVGDTVRFKYKKDSVMKVTEEEYKECNSSHPSFFSNTGNTLYKLNHSGPFYFVSGVSGHCERGQKIIIKVMAPEEDYPSHGGAKKSAASRSISLPSGVFNLATCVQLLVSYVGSHFFY